MMANHTLPLGREHCALCLAYHTDKRYRDLVDGRASIARPVHLVDQTCRFLGDEVALKEVILNGLDRRRKWQRCFRGLGTVAGCACRCATCGPQCKGFELDDEG